MLGSISSLFWVHPHLTFVCNLPFKRFAGYCSVSPHGVCIQYCSLSSAVVNCSTGALPSVFLQYCRLMHDCQYLDTSGQKLFLWAVSLKFWHQTYIHVQTFTFLGRRQELVVSSQMCHPKKEGLWHESGQCYAFSYWALMMTSPLPGMWEPFTYFLDSSQKHLVYLLLSLCLLVEGRSRVSYSAILLMPLFSFTFDG